MSLGTPRLAIPAEISPERDFKITPRRGIPGVMCAISLSVRLRLRHWGSPKPELSEKMALLH